MKKIENVIEKCNDCKHCQFLQELKGNTFFAAICTWNDEEKEIPPFIIQTSSESPKHFYLGIPENCPLETYEP